MDEAGIQTYRNMTTPEERLTFFQAIGLFPVCGHHRVVASLELADETRDKRWLIWDNVKIVLPPEGEAGRTIFGCWGCTTTDHLVKNDIL